ncbi:hypothetical protein [Acinetobacter towneri]|uniref:hypothetical protein n=1 Tax=Acinetobacter towneri TaxID=202956 RepID=UPI0014369A0E|nr:hypothetical protein [Acinetobacter towneri]MCA4815350.1 hypothetical protein [Acinetobacter towneri]QIV93700.1 hypothetical protein GVU25_12840 [Acinetobacter towneri]
MLKYFYLAALMLLSNAAIADVPMILITDGTKKDAEEVIGIAASSISESTDPEAARKAVFEQEGGQEKAEKSKNAQKADFETSRLFYERF